jgi:hypothetical protein
MVCGFTELRLTVVNGMWLRYVFCFSIAFFSIEIETISECREEEILFS